MALKTFNPTTPGRRGLVLVDRSGLWKGKPERSSAGANVYDILHRDTLVLTRDGVEKLVERLK